MDARAVFAISAVLTLVSSVVVATLYVWPWLQRRERAQALGALVSPHLFLRFLGLSFLVPGVVASGLPAAFAVPAAYGDLGAGILALVAITAVAKRAAWAIPAVWVFNVWGAADLVFAFYAGPHAQLRPEMLGAAFYIPTAIVPPLLVTHLLIFRILLRPQANR